MLDDYITINEQIKMIVFFPLESEQQHQITKEDNLQCIDNYQQCEANITRPLSDSQRLRNNT